MLHRQLFKLLPLRVYLVYEHFDILFMFLLGLFHQFLAYLRGLPQFANLNLPFVG